MRAHGVPRFPDPAQIAQLGAQGRRPTPQQLGASTAQFQAALAPCRRLLPNLGPPQRPTTITPADHADYLKGAACMRLHGFPDFPDPTIRGNNVKFNIPSSIDANSPTFKNAEATCDRLIPPGLPYSGSG
jgi:hypothetical protein